MKILGLGVAHDASAIVLNNGELVYYLKEEALTGVKRDGLPIKTMIDASANHSPIDAIAYSTPTNDIAELFTRNSLKVFAQKVTDATLVDYADSHHLCHAALAFYNSGFDEAYNVVIDCQGSLEYNKEADRFEGRETESIFEASYPAKFDRIAANPIHWFGITRLYGVITNMIGENDLENGKTMGLSAYGKDTNSPPFFDGWQPKKYSDFKNCYIPFEKNNRKMAKHERRGENWRDEIRPEIQFTLDNIIKDLPMLDWGEMNSVKVEYQEYADLAKKIQKESEDAVLNFVFEHCDFKACKNITFSGGYALNCLANFRYTQELPPDVNIFIEPNADDAGVSLGAAKHLWHTKSNDKTKRPLADIYQAGNTWDLTQLDNYLRTYT